MAIDLDTNLIKPEHRFNCVSCKDSGWLPPLGEQTMMPRSRCPHIVERNQRLAQTNVQARWSK